MRPRDHLPSLDGVRAVCIALVLLGHLVFYSTGFPAGWARPLGYVANAGLGVMVFFVLSGFLISYLLGREEAATGRIALGPFYARRALRIVPVCYAYVLVLAVLDASTRVQLSACDYATALAYLRDFDSCGHWLDGHLWSLSVEEQFYLLWPVLLALAPTRLRMGVAAAAVVVAPAFRLWCLQTGRQFPLAFSFLANVDALMIGSVVGLAFADRREVVERVVGRHAAVGRAIAFGTIALVWVFSGRVRFAPATVSLGRSFTAAAVAYLIVSYVVVRRGLGFRLLNLRPVRYVGVLSYSLYVWQQMFLVPPGTYAATHPWFLRFPYNLVAAFATAAASYHLFEKPLLRLRARFRRDDSLAHAEAGPAINAAA